MGGRHHALEGDGRARRATRARDAIGGLILLAIAGSLPELAITISAAAQGHLGLAAGNLIGGIAIQTMVCSSRPRRRAPRPLTYLVGRLAPVLEGLLVVSLSTA